MSSIFTFTQPPPPAYVPTLREVLTPPPEVRKRPEEVHAERVAAEIGEAVGVRRHSLQEVVAAMQDGVLVTATITRYRGLVTLSPQDLGIPASELGPLLDRRVLLGKKRLIPKDTAGALDTAESAGRQAVYRYGIKTGYGWFVPTKKFRHFKAEFQAAREKFLEAMEAYLAGYGSAVDEIRRDYAALARQAWLGSRKTWTDIGKVPLGTYRDAPEPTPSFVQDFVERIVALFPSAEAIRGSVRFDYALTVLHAPDAELAAQFATSDAGVNAELREHMLAQKRSIIDDFLQSTRDALASHVMELVEEVRVALSGRKVVHGRTVSKILDHLVEMRELNITRDEEMADVLDGFQRRVESLSSRAAADRARISAEDMQQALGEVAESVALAVKKAVRATSGFENLT